jgi:hypothetical protein
MAECFLRVLSIRLVFDAMRRDVLIKLRVTVVYLVTSGNKIDDCYSKVNKPPYHSLF